MSFILRTLLWQINDDDDDDDNTYTSLVQYGMSLSFHDEFKSFSMNRHT